MRPVHVWNTLGALVSVSSRSEGMGSAASRLSSPGPLPLHACYKPDPAGRWAVRVSTRWVYPTANRSRPMHSNFAAYAGSPIQVLRSGKPDALRRRGQQRNARIACAVHRLCREIQFPLHIWSSGSRNAKSGAHGYRRCWHQRSTSRNGSRRVVKDKSWHPDSQVIIL
jgi:hypothetical protein